MAGRRPAAGLKAPPLIPPTLTHPLSIVKPTASAKYELSACTLVVATWSCIRECKGHNNLGEVRLTKGNAIPETRVAKGILVRSCVVLGHEVRKAPGQERACDLGYTVEESVGELQGAPDIYAKRNGRVVVGTRDVRAGEGHYHKRPTDADRREVAAGRAYRKTHEKSTDELRHQPTDEVWRHSTAQGTETGLRYTRLRFRFHGFHRHGWLLRVLLYLPPLLQALGHEFGVVGGAAAARPAGKNGLFL